jgi:hypothetical protein
MRILLIIGLVAEVIALLFSMCMRDLNVKTLDETRDYGGMVIGKSGAVDAIKEQVYGPNRAALKTEAMKSSAAKVEYDENKIPVNSKESET